ncbi:MAG: flagellar protein FlgN, partial [Congregibacter sp.]|nr:flagellar protein FlgN [Congregibacter sp.]
MSAGQLTDLLTAEINTLKGLELALTAEHEALIGNKVAELESATAAKNSAVVAHRTQQAQRIAWMQSLDLPPDTSLRDLVSRCGTTEA